MNKSAIIVHGKPSRLSYENPDLPSASNSIWLPWLQQQLLLRDYDAQTPEMLRAYQPDYTIWKKTFERYQITPDTLLIGHSCGGGFLVQWLSEHPEVRVGGVYLVAPAFGDTLTPDARYDEPLLGGFFDFTPDPLLQERIGQLHLLMSDNDSVRVDATVALIRANYSDLNVHNFSGAGHFTRDKDDQTKSIFPELLDIIDASILR